MGGKKTTEGQTFGNHLAMTAKENYGHLTISENIKILDDCLRISESAAYFQLKQTLTHNITISSAFLFLHSHIVAKTINFQSSCDVST